MSAPPGFAAALIAALQDAQAAAAQPKPGAHLAQAAWSKLQFDFPVVSADELSALVQEYAAGTRTEVSARFLSVLRENAAAPPAAGDSGNSSAAGGSAQPSASAGPAVAAPENGATSLVPLFQRLYAVSVLQSLRACLEDAEPDAAARLAVMLPEAEPAANFFSQEGTSRLEEAQAAAAEEQAAAPLEREHGALQEDDDGMVYEPLEPRQSQQAQRRQQRQQRGSRPAQGAASAGPAALPQQLAQLADHLSYHCMSDAQGWRELGLTQRVAACLAATRRHPRFIELQASVQPLLRLSADRLVACPIELESGLPALLDALSIPSSGSKGSSSSSGSGGAAVSKQDAAASAAAAELALGAVVTLAGQVSSPAARRRLWAEIHARLLPVVAALLEEQQVALARAARAAGSGSKGGTAAEVQLPPEQVYRIMLPCQLLYFYVLEAPRVGTGPASSAQLQDAFLQAGLLRSLVLLFLQLGASSGAEPLRCALLLACGAAQPLTDWAAAVPGFTAAVGAPGMAPGGEAALHGALWRLLLGADGAELAALLGDATPAEKVPGVFQALQLMADLQAVSRRPTPLWGADVEVALRSLADTLRQHYGRQRQDEEAQAGSACPEAATPAGAEAAIAAAGEQGAQHDGADADDAEDEKKLGRPAEEHAAVLAARRAARVQPACLRLIKDLLQRRAGGGKHD